MQLSPFLLTKCFGHTRPLSRVSNSLKLFPVPGSYIRAFSSLIYSFIPNIQKALCVLSLIFHLFIWFNCFLLLSYCLSPPSCGCNSQLKYFSQRKSVGVPVPVQGACVDTRKFRDLTEDYKKGKILRSHLIQIKSNWMFILSLFDLVSSQQQFSSRGVLNQSSVVPCRWTHLLVPLSQ